MNNGVDSTKKKSLRSNNDSNNSKNTSNKIFKSFSRDVINKNRKTKVSFYLPKSLSELFNEAFYSLKISKAPIKNKSEFMSYIVQFSLNELKNNDNSKILEKIYNDAIP